MSLEFLKCRGILLSATPEGGLKYACAPGVMTPKLLEMLRRNKSALIILLSDPGANIALEMDPDVGSPANHDGSMTGQTRVDVGCVGYDGSIKLSSKKIENAQCEGINSTGNIKSLFNPSDPTYPTLFQLNKDVNPTYDPSRPNIDPSRPNINPSGSSTVEQAHGLSSPAGQTSGSSMERQNHIPHNSGSGITCLGLQMRLLFF